MYTYVVAKKASTISIIIPATNESADISNLISHIRESSSLQVTHEIIIVKSLDLKRETASHNIANTNITYSVHQRSAAMNAGAKVACGDILYFLHADSYPPNRFDELIVDAIRSGAGAGSFRLRFDTSNLMLKTFALFTRFNWYWVRFGDQSLFVSATNFKLVGGFNEDLSTMEDTNIVKRLKKHTSFAVISKQVVTSARKYKKYGYIRVQSFYIVVVILYHLGFSQHVLLKILHKMTRGK